MTLSKKAANIYAQINQQTKLGDLRKIAKEIKKDQELAEELWTTKTFLPRLLSILIMDSKALQTDGVEKLFDEIDQHEYDERLQLADWLMANQLMKNKKIVSEIESWENHASALQRRIFWYHQARLRWVGQIPPDNTKELLASIEKKISSEAPEVQWAMNFTAAWIGVFDKTNRDKCIKMGEKFGLYKDEVVHKGCTPSYLPKFIEIEANKRKLA